MSSWRRGVPVLDHVLALLAAKDLRDQQRFDAQSQALAAALLAAEKAVDKANTANEKRFESVNEFRQALTDQTSTFPSRVELNALSDRVTDLATRLDRTEGRSTGLSDGTRLAIQLGGLILAALTLYLALKH